MSDRPRSLAFVMDPVEAIDISADTTFVLMLEAQQRGHAIFAIDPADLGVASGHPTARVTPVTLRREVGNHATLGAPRSADLEAEMDAIFQRKDPPVDAAYVTATQILALCERALVFNRPSGILAHNEKLCALRFFDLMPATCVSADTPELLAFLDDQGGEMIVKPLDGKGGEGIFRVRRDDPNLGTVLELSTDYGTRAAMAQAFVPEVSKGDKRILLLEGEPLGAVLRVPPQGQTRANFHAGGQAAAAGLDADDRRILEAVGPWCAAEGLFFVGIDVIGGRLTEINVTSPTGIQEMNALDGEAYERRILDRVEARIAAHAGARS